MNYTIPKNFTHYNDVILWANTQVDGILALGVLISILIITLYSTSMYERKRSIVASLFLTAVSATFMLYLGWIGAGIWATSVILFFMSYLLVYLQE